MNTKNVLVTTHALERWRERGAVYANDSEADVIAAYRSARLVSRDEPVPGKRRAGSTYYLHAPTGCYFVVEAVDPKTDRIVTVKPPPLPVLTLTHKPKRKQQKPPASLMSREAIEAESNVLFRELRQLRAELEMMPEGEEREAKKRYYNKVSNRLSKISSRKPPPTISA